MCFGDGGASQRAAAAATAEASRQAEIERQRLAAEAATAKAEADQRYAEEVAREQARLDQQKADAETLRQQLADQNTATLAAQQKIENERKAERDADLLRQQNEQKAAADAAAAKAAGLSKYSADRQGLVDSARAQIEAAFGNFSDDYYKKYASDYVSAMTPQLDQQYNDAKRSTTFDFARKGSLQSTGAARSFGRLDETRAGEQAQIAQAGQTQANNFRSSVDKQKSDLLNGIFGAVNAAPVITADNVGDANSALTALSNSLNSPVSLAGSAASTIAPPAFGSLNNVFNVPTSSVGPRTTYAPAGAGAYSASKSGSGRLVA